MHKSNNKYLKKRLQIKVRNVNYKDIPEMSEEIAEALNQCFQNGSLPSWPNLTKLALLGKSSLSSVDKTLTSQKIYMAS